MCQDLHKCGRRNTCVDRLTNIYALTVRRMLIRECIRSVSQTKTSRVFCWARGWRQRRWSAPETVIISCRLKCTGCVMFCSSDRRIHECRNGRADRWIVSVDVLLRIVLQKDPHSDLDHIGERIQYIASPSLSVLRSEEWNGAQNSVYIVVSEVVKEIDVDCCALQGLKFFCENWWLLAEN